MSNLAGKGPLGLKTKKLPKNPAYLNKVRSLPCACCGKPGPSEAHHCRDLPDHDERGLYERLPAAALKSGDRDAIPLCQHCHWKFHNRRSEFHARAGKDYGHIAPTRAALSHMEVSF